MNKYLLTIFYGCLLYCFCLHSDQAFGEDKSGDFLPIWTTPNGVKFDILEGYLKNTVKKIMDDKSAPLPGGIFAINFSFDCHDFNGNELFCGLYCDNQWGGNRDEQYYFIPLKYEILGQNHFRLSLDRSRPVATNKNASTDWVRNSAEMQYILRELCNESGWLIGQIPQTPNDIFKWVLKRYDSQDKKKLYSNNMDL